MLKYSAICRRYHAFHSKKLSKEAIKTLPTHDLMQTLGFIKQSQSGLVHWLPMGLRSLNKIENIIRHRMNNDGNAIEVQLTSLSAKSLWELTGRWSNSELFKLKDAKKTDYCLTATAEEDITALMKNYISSYKDMPLVVYQITRKYRDELRPRGGLLRGREFLMKDAYSFASNKQEAIALFEHMNAVYDKIFTDLKIPFISAWADSGDMGGDLSKEYHYVHSSGEDTLLKCNECGSASNVEKCESFPEENAAYLGDVKVKYALSKDHKTLICFYYPYDRQLNWNLALDTVDHDIDHGTKDADNNDTIKLFQEENDDVIFSQVLRVMDCRLSSRSNFPDFPLKQYLKNNFGQIDDVSLVDAIEGEICGACNKGHLSAKRTIEVGHTFYLGTKYSKPLEVKFTSQENNSSLVEMGCYGIGVSRLLGAIGEVTRDGRGFRWPTSMAPYVASICVAPGNERISEQIMGYLENSALRDEIMCSFNEKLGMGARINYSHAAGIPLCIIAGPKYWPKVEIEVRGKIWDTNDKRQTWKDKYQELKDDLGWEIVEDNNGLTKHLVLVDHLSDVLSILSREL